MCCPCDIAMCCVLGWSTYRESESGGEPCPIIFGPDHRDPDHADLYTSGWTPYPSIEHPVSYSDITPIESDRQPSARTQFKTSSVLLMVMMMMAVAV